MGNNNSNGQLDVLRASRPGQWVREGSTGYSDIVRSTATGQVAEQYSVQVDSRLSQEDNIARYQYRFGNNQYIVGVYRVEKEDNQYICQGQEHVKVFTERIPLRLSEVGRVTTEEGLYIFHQALQGFRTIYELQGMTHINDDMICLTPEGRVKVWLNDNLACNLPDADNRVIHQNEMVMVDQITDIVKEHIAGNAFPYRLREMMAQHPPNTFEQAIVQLQSYLQASRTSLPGNIRSINISAQQNIQPNNRQAPTVHTNVTRESKTEKPQVLASQPEQKVQYHTSHQSQPTQSRHIHSISTQQPQAVNRQPTNTTQPANSIPRAQTVHAKPPIQPLQSVNATTGSSKPSITINIPFSQNSNVFSASNSSVNTQQQSQIVQRAPGSLATQQFARPVGVYNKATAINQVSPNSRVIKADTSNSTISSKLTQSVHHLNPQSASQIRIQTLGSKAEYQQSNGLVSFEKPPEATSTIFHRNQSMPLLQQQNKQMPHSGVQYTGEKSSPVKEASLQSQIEKLKEVTKMVGIKPQPSEVRTEAVKGASFVSPPTSIKTIKFDVEPIKEQGRIFVRAQQASTHQPGRNGFMKKEAVVASNSPQQGGFIKTAKPTQAVAANIIEQPKYIPRHQTTVSSTNTNATSNSTSTANKWTRPIEVTAMESIRGNTTNPTNTISANSQTKVESSSSTPSSNKPKVITVKANVNMDRRVETRGEAAKQGTVMPSEMEELDELQNRLSEIVSKTKKLTEPSGTKAS